MRTAETRHLAKREKKYLEKPDGRRHLKAVLSESAKEFARPEGRGNNKAFTNRQALCLEMRRKNRRRAD